MAVVSENLYNFNPGILSKDARIVIVHTEWNADIVDKLLNGCIALLKQYEMHNYKTLQVPGAFEIPFAIKKYWDTNQYDLKKPWVFIALGCVLKGDTPHFEYVCKAVTDGIVQLNLQLPIPTVFGILTVDNRHQADDRTGGIHGNKGEEAAITALKMMSLKFLD